jgi:hypothetical protein
MKLKLRPSKKLDSNDYYWAFTLSEVLFLLFGLASRLYDKNYGIPGLFFMFLGILFAIKAFDIDHPGFLDIEMGE